MVLKDGMILKIKKIFILNNILINVLLAIRFLLDYKSNELDKHNQQEKKANSNRKNS